MIMIKFFVISFFDPAISVLWNRSWGAVGWVFLPGGLGHTKEMVKWQKVNKRCLAIRRGYTTTCQDPQKADIKNKDTMEGALLA